MVVGVSFYDVLLESPAQFRIYKSGKIDRLNERTLSPTGLDEATGVTSKDVVLDADTGVSVRLYLPMLKEPAASYDDSWAALQWAAVSAQDDWITQYGDTSRLFLAGDSAGANIVHDMLMRAASDNDGGEPRIEGAILLHPWFSGSTAIEGEPPAAAMITGMLWSYACPGAVGGADDPRMNPLAPGAPALEKLGCVRMLVTAGLKDGLAARDRAYYDALVASGWRGDAAWLESEGEGHVFFLEKPGCENAKQLMDRVVAFIAGS